MRSALAALASTLLLAPLCVSQQPSTAAVPAASPGLPAPATLSVGTKLVNIPVVVRDNKGALVQNLTKADFSLVTDGKPQTIRYFDLDRDLPLSLGLLVDTSQSQRNVIDEERTASAAFLDSMLTGKEDAAFVAQFAHSVELLQEMTVSRAKLQAALKQIDTPNPNEQADSGDSSSGSGRRSRGGTTLYDAVFLASDELMSKQKGRKALVVLSDGDDRGSKERLTDAIEAAQRSDTIVYAIYFKGQEARPSGVSDGSGSGFPRRGGFPGGGGGYPGGGGGRGSGGNREPEQRPDGKKILERMAHETGGRLFEVTRKQPVADVYTEIGKELRAQYRLGYIPDADAASDGYHKIDLAFTGADKKKYTIQTRDGYYAGR